MRLQDTVSSNWKEMRRQFRILDPSGTGLVDSIDFRSVLRQFSVNLDEDEFYHLMQYYDKNMDGKIGYNDFIRAYLPNSWSHSKYKRMCEQYFSFEANCSSMQFILSIGHVTSLWDFYWHKCFYKSTVLTVWEIFL